MFITFEGIEGSGKSTQRKRLLDWLDVQEISYISTREPGGTEVGQVLRELLLSNQSKIASNRTELFLFAADRCEHLAQVVKPALDRGDWVVCDRYIDSTYAYQSGGREHSEKDILDIIRLTDAIEPDMTFLLDMSPEEGLQRAKERADLDRFENEKLVFHQRVRSAYLMCAEKNKHRFCVIPSDGRSIEDIFDMIITKIKERRQLA